MQLGLIGLGRMGAGLAGRLIERGHSIVGFDLSAQDVERLVGRGGTGARSLENIADHVDDSGTGRWAVDYALEQGVPVPAISISLFERFDSRVQKRFAHQVIAALRNQFGGHAVKESES